MKVIEKDLNVSFPKIEVIYIAIHLLGTKLVRDQLSTNETIETVMDDKIHSAILAMLSAVEIELIFRYRK